MKSVCVHVWCFVCVVYICAYVLYVRCMCMHFGVCVLCVYMVYMCIVYIMCVCMVYVCCIHYVCMLICMQFVYNLCVLCRWCIWICVCMSVLVLGLCLSLWCMQYVPVCGYPHLCTQIQDPKRKHLVMSSITVFLTSWSKSISQNLTLTSLSRLIGQHPPRISCLCTSIQGYEWAQLCHAWTANCLTQSFP